MKLVILDRDGVINFDSPNFIKSPDEFIPIPGSFKAIAALKQAGYTVAVATNQSGVGRGLFTTATLQAIHEKLQHELALMGGHIDFFAVCPHTPDDNCLCRKPLPGLLRQIAEYYQCRLVNVPVIGDSTRDLAAAVAANAEPWLVLTGNGKKTLQQLISTPDSALSHIISQKNIYPDLKTAVEALIQRGAVL